MQSLLVNFTRTKMKSFLYSTQQIQEEWAEIARGAREPYVLVKSITHYDQGGIHVCIVRIACWHEENTERNLISKDFRVYLNSENRKDAA